MRLQKRLNIALTVALTIAFILLGAFVFRVAYCRIIEALIDLYGSFKYYFCVLFGFPVDGIPSVAERSKVLNWDVILPADFETFKANCIAFFRLFISKENFLSWLNTAGGKAGVWAKIFVILLPCILAVIIAIKRLYAKGNTKHNVDTVPLRVYKTVTSYTTEPLKRFVRQYAAFVKEHNFIWIIWLVIWIFNLNFATIIIEFFAYYFYFAVSFDFGSIYTQIVKLIIDLQVVVKYVPFWVILIFIWLLFERWRRNLALAKLRRMENSNRGFINDLPIVSMTCGSMGKKKTTIITDMTLSQEIMFRNVAYGKLQETDMKFPKALEPLSENIIKHLHLLLKQGTKDSSLDWFAVGDYKKRANTVGGRETCKPSEVHKAMDKLVTNFNSKSDIAIDDIIELHADFEYIHPFQDGNGRVGRLIALKECLRFNIIPFIIEDSKKSFYYRGLANWNQEKGWLRDTCLDGQDTFKRILKVLDIHE